MKTQPTPGLWTADESCRESEIEPRNIQVKGWHPGDSIPMKRIATCYYGADDAERIANARLIAAAPELLAQLADAADAIDAIIRDVPGGAKDALREINKRNRAAIAKARGVA